MQAIKEIEADFGQPFTEVVAGFAQDGHGPESIAQILEIPESVIHKRCMSKLFAKPIKRNSRPVEEPKDGTGTPRKMTEEWRQKLRQNAKKGGGATKWATWIWYQGIHDTISGHCARLGTNSKTARTRYRKRPDDLDWVFYPGNHSRGGFRSGQE